MLDAFYDECAEAIWEHDGLLNKTMGDAVMAIFNFPIRRDDHPSSGGACAARAIQERWKARRDAIAQCGDRTEQGKIAVGVGIDSGEVSFGEFGRTHHDLTAIGTVVNTASRAQSVAAADEILLTRAVYERAPSALSESGAQRISAQRLRRADPALGRLRAFGHCGASSTLTHPIGVKERSISGRIIMAADANTAGQTSLWHAMSVDEAVKRLATHREKGLDATEAAARLKKYGANRLPAGKKRGPFMRFLAQFNNILVYVLLGAGFVKLMLSLWVDAAIIFAVVVLNALLGFIQEGRAEKALDSIRNMLSAEARTVRGGETRMLPAEELVPGDIVLLESGDKVPADLRLVEAKNLRTEEAALTGESVPVGEDTPTPFPTTPRSATASAWRSPARWSCPVARRALSSRPAAETELGRINQLLADVSPLETPLLRQIKKFGYTITAAIGVLSVLIFSYGHWVAAHGLSSSCSRRSSASRCR